MKRFFEGGMRNKQLLSWVAVGVIVGALLLPLVISIPLLAQEFEEASIEQAAAGEIVGEEVPAQEIGYDIHYGDEGIVQGPPAPVTSDNENDYPRYNFESRVIIWVATQQHPITAALCSRCRSS